MDYIYGLFSNSQDFGCYTKFMETQNGKKPRENKRKNVRRVLSIVLVLFLTLPFLVNGAVCFSAQNFILTPEEAAALDADCILVLGAGVWEGDRPSHMLNDRLEVAISLYEAGAAPKLLMSGDHGREEYDEVNVMKAFAVEHGVPSKDVFMDHAGFSTYESIYRARDVFQARTVVVITQEYHLYRAIYVARSLGLTAYGVSADLREYRGQAKYDIREILARCKDFVMTILRPKPTYLGEPIPITGSGDLTNDR